MNLLSLVTLLMADNFVSSSEMITLHYMPRPPYAMKKGDTVEGLYATPAAEAFTKAHIPFQWAETPVNRQFNILKDNRGLDCAIGFFKKPERELFVNFTKPYYKGKEGAVLANIEIDYKPDYSFRKFLASPKNIILMKDNFSYGKVADEIIQELKPNKYITTTENSQMVQMIKMRSNYYMMATMEELDYFMEKNSFVKDKDIRLLTFKDMPPSELRYIICSKKVDKSIIEKLNNVIKPI